MHGAASRVESTAQRKVKQQEERAGHASAIVSAERSGGAFSELIEDLRVRGSQFIEQLCALSAEYQEVMVGLHEAQQLLNIFQQHRNLPLESQSSSSLSLAEQFREAVNLVGNRLFLETKEASLSATIREVYCSANKLLSSAYDLNQALDSISMKTLRDSFSSHQFSLIKHELSTLGIEYSDSVLNSNGEYGAWIFKGLLESFNDIKSVCEASLSEIKQFRENSLPKPIREQQSRFRTCWLSFLQKMNQLYQRMLFIIFWVLRSLRQFIYGQRVDPKIGNPQACGQGSLNVQERAFLGKKRPDLSEEEAIQRPDAEDSASEAMHEHQDESHQSDDSYDSGNEADSEHEESDEDS